LSLNISMPSTTSASPRRYAATALSHVPANYYFKFQTPLSFFIYFISAHGRFPLSPQRDGHFIEPRIATFLLRDFDTNVMTYMSRQSYSQSTVRRAFNTIFAAFAILDISTIREVFRFQTWIDIYISFVLIDNSCHIIARCYLLHIAGFLLRCVQLLVSTSNFTTNSHNRTEFHRNFDFSHFGTALKNAWLIIVPST
jgi:hypothetical protein